MNELQTTNNNQLQKQPSIQMSVKDRVKLLIERKSALQAVMKELMLENVHYYTIKKSKSLSKIGAETLCSAFALGARYVKISELYDGDHIDLTFQCILFSQETGLDVTDGWGRCTSKEVKFKYREENELDENGRWAKDADGKFITHKVENDELPDLYNGVMKRAMKRALVSATLLATGAGDIFSQNIIAADLDDSINEVMINNLSLSLKDIKDIAELRVLNKKWDNSLKVKNINESTHKAGINLFIEKQKSFEGSQNV